MTENKVALKNMTEKELKELDNQKQMELLKFEETRNLSIELDKQVSLIDKELIHIEKMSNQLILFLILFFYY